MFLEECKFVVTEEKIPKYIIDDIKISSDSDRENSNEENTNEEKSGVENSSEENLNEKILMKKVLKNFKITHILKFIFKTY